MSALPKVFQDIFRMHGIVTDEILRDNDRAIDVFDDLTSDWDRQDVANLGCMVLRGDRDGVFNMIEQAVNASIRRTQRGNHG